MAINSYVAPDGSKTESRILSHVSGDSPFIAQHESQESYLRENSHQTSESILIATQDHIHEIPDKFVPTLKLAGVIKQEPNSELNVFMPVKISTTRQQALKEEELQTERYEILKQDNRTWTQTVSAFETSRTNSLVHKSNKMTNQITDESAKISCGSKILIGDELEA